MAQEKQNARRAVLAMSPIELSALRQQIQDRADAFFRQDERFDEYINGDVEEWFKSGPYSAYISGILMSILKERDERDMP